MHYQFKGKVVNNLLSLFFQNLHTLLFVIFIWTSVSYGTEPEKDKDTEFSIDYASLVNSKREKVKEIVDKNTVTRILRNIEFKIDEPVLMYMIDHPVFLSATLRAMKIANYVIKHEKNETYSYDDGKGLKGTYEVVYSDKGQRYYYGSGKYKGMIIKLIGKGLILSKFRIDKNVPNRVYLDANVYAKIENMLLRVLMKILKPIVIPLIDKKINKFIKEFQGLVEEIAMHPEKIYQSVKESGYASDNDLEEFKRIIKKNNKLSFRLHLKD